MIRFRMANDDDDGRVKEHVVFSCTYRKVSMKHLIICWSKPWMETIRRAQTANSFGVRNTMGHKADAVGQNQGAGAAFVATGWREAKLLGGLLRNPAEVASCSIGKDHHILIGGQIMEAKSRDRCGLVALAMVGILAVLATPPLSAQAVIPEGSTITQAYFSIVAQNDTGQTVYVHRVLADWGEGTVTWDSFGGSFDPNVVGSFIVASGWNSVDVTALVQAWVNGDVPNFGILLEQPSSDITRYWSSEFEYPDERPRLEIWYISPSGVYSYVLIQRPDEAQDGVKDAYVAELYPSNNGNGRTINTGFYDGWEKSSLIHFLFIVEPPPLPPGTGTPGYWKNHPDAWPVETIDIGGITYTKAEARAILKSRVKKDMTIVMFKSLVAAKLNVMIGNDDSCIWSDIQAGDAWLMDYPLGSGVKAGGKDSPWRVGEPIHLMLDDYNNGLLDCADHRD